MTSCPLCAGKQCKNIASIGALANKSLLTWYLFRIWIFFDLSFSSSFIESQVSVTIQFASLIASSIFWVILIFELFLAISKIAFLGIYSFGVAMFSLKSNKVLACIHVFATLLPSPIHATLRPSIVPKHSFNVIKSAIIWQGWLSLVRALMIDIAEWLENSIKSWWLAFLIIIPSTYLDNTLAVSLIVSPLPSCVVFISR